MVTINNTIQLFGWKFNKKNGLYINIYKSKPKDQVIYLQHKLKTNGSQNEYIEEKKQVVPLLIEHFD